MVTFSGKWLLGVFLLKNRKLFVHGYVNKYVVVILNWNYPIVLLIDILNYLLCMLNVVKSGGNENYEKFSKSKRNHHYNGFKRAINC